MMRSKILVIAAGAMLAGCSTVNARPEAGLASVNVPVVNRASYTYDAVAPGGVLAAGEAERLDAWFRALDMRYGDTVYVDGGALVAREQVAQVAGRYGLLVNQGSPATAGALGPNSVRVVVSRTEARVPNCPNWSRTAPANFDNLTGSNFGCGVNSNLAAMAADPNDLVHGRAAGSASDGATAAKAIKMYRDWPLTGVLPGQELRPLTDVNTKKDDE